MHTIIPGMTMSDGRCDMSFGVMGGALLSRWAMRPDQSYNVHDYGMDVQHGDRLAPGFIEGEQGVGRARHAAGDLSMVCAREATRWRKPNCRGAAARPMKIDWDRGVLIGASDPRKDGLALGLPAGVVVHSVKSMPAFSRRSKHQLSIC